MPRILVLGLLALTLVAAGCSGGDDAAVVYDSPESAVVAWFEAIDAGSPDAATDAVVETSLSLILGIENSLSPDQLAVYVADGVPDPVQASYWASFADGFTEFAARPISTLTVGESSLFEAADLEFASVPVTGSPATESVIIARRVDDGWKVDLVATLGDGFANLLLTTYESIPAGESGDVVRSAYSEVVAPGLWAAMTAGEFGDGFTRAAMAVVDAVEAGDG